MPTMKVSEETLRRIDDHAIPYEDNSREDVIKRLLAKAENDRNGRGGHTESPADLVTRAGRIPHGSDLRATYKGKEYHARVDDGSIVWNGRRFGSPSKAAVAVIRSTGSDRTTENGWRFWEIRLPNQEEWKSGLDVKDS